MKRTIYAACAAATLALAIPAVQSYADTPAPSAAQQEQWKQRREEWMQKRSEIFDARLVGFKASLALTGDQEKNWAPFETALRDAAKPRAAMLLEPRKDAEAGPDQTAQVSPIDRMRAFSKRMGERSTKLGALADAAQPLYASLDDRQKVVFDATLRGFMRPHRFGPGGPEGRRWERRD
jgi:hypothetical protein